MTDQQIQTSPMGQAIFFEIIEASEDNRSTLALIALGMANADNGRPLILSQVLNCLHWNQYQAMLSMLSLKAHAPIIWTPDQMELLKLWVEE
jgi:S-methylmethionine-dependent homocysteine/selenocysteine methylase